MQVYLIYSLFGHVEIHIDVVVSFFVSIRLKFKPRIDCRHNQRTVGNIRFLDLRSIGQSNCNVFSYVFEQVATASWPNALSLRYVTK